MITAFVTASIGIVCIAAFLIFTLSDKQKKKAVVISLITKSILELNQNKEVLKEILKVLKPKELSITSESDLEKNVEKKLLPIGLEPPIFKHEESEQLKANNDFLTISDINLSVELNNVILRVKYLNQLFPDLNNVSVLSTDDYKTVFHTYEMTEKLIKAFEDMLNKLKH